MIILDITSYLNSLYNTIAETFLNQVWSYLSANPILLVIVGLALFFVLAKATDVILKVLGILLIIIGIAVLLGV